MGFPPPNALDQHINNYFLAFQVLRLVSSVISDKKPHNLIVYCYSITLLLKMNITFVSTLQNILHSEVDGAKVSLELQISTDLHLACYK